MWYLAKLVSYQLPLQYNQLVNQLVSSPLSTCGWSKFHDCFITHNQIRGMTIDQAIAQLEFNDKKGAKVIKEVRNSTTNSLKQV